MTVNTPKTHGDILSMSDAEFLATSHQISNVPVEEEEVEVVVPPQEEETPEVPTPVETPTPVEAVAPTEVVTPVVPASAEAVPAVEPVKPVVETPPASVIDYAAVGKDLLAPLTANGKTIEIRTPEEARQLMQMGANYTKKMQSIAPHRKVLMMLEKNDLLDEDKLSFLIDIQKKDPNAIKKMLKESGIDPLDIDTNAEPTYQQGNHRVSDSEAAFRTTLEDLQSTPEGQKTIQVIHSDWDQASKEVLWESPDIMKVIQQQREIGIYDKIAAEVDRRKALGVIPPNAPFLQAYKLVGDDLVAEQARTKSVTTPVATTVAKPKPAVANGAKVSAASPTRSTPRTSEPIINPLAMADDEFMKFMAKRL